jgi:hypothetical protein
MRKRLDRQAEARLRGSVFAAAVAPAHRGERKTLHLFSSFRGASEASEPGIHIHRPGIPGPRLLARPGMTN